MSKISYYKIKFSFTKVLRSRGEDEYIKENFIYGVVCESEEIAKSIVKHKFRNERDLLIDQIQTHPVDCIINVVQIGKGNLA